MDNKEAARRIEEHMRIHRLQEKCSAVMVTEALNMAIDTLLEKDGDVPPRRCGKWVVKYPEDGEHDMYNECPNCGCQEQDFLAQFCRRCGTRMSIN